MNRPSSANCVRVLCDACWYTLHYPNLRPQDHDTWLCCSCLLRVYATIGPNDWATVGHRPMVLLCGRCRG